MFVVFSQIQWKKKCCQNKTFGDLVTNSLKLFSGIQGVIQHIQGHFNVKKLASIAQTEVPGTAVTKWTRTILSVTSHKPRVTSFKRRSLIGLNKPLSDSPEKMSFLVFHWHISCDLIGQNQRTSISPWKIAFIITICDHENLDRIYENNYKYLVLLTKNSSSSFYPLSEDELIKTLLFF